MDNVLPLSKNIIEVLKSVRAIEEEYKSKKHRTYEDIENYYYDGQVLELWEVEQLVREDREQCPTFEKFLIDYIQHEIFVAEEFLH